MSTEEDLAAIKAATREMHEAIADGRRLLKSLKHEEAQLILVSRTVFEERMEEEVKACLDNYQANMAKQIENATEAVYARFDTISNMLLYGNKQGRGENILETAAAKRAAEEGQS